ncbi:hypothetical protein ACMFMG_009569 [Clarireedia jacksonii]
MILSNTCKESNDIFHENYGTLAITGPEDGKAILGYRTEGQERNWRHDERPEVLPWIEEDTLPTNNNVELFLVSQKYSILPFGFPGNFEPDCYTVVPSYSDPILTYIAKACPKLKNFSYVSGMRSFRDEFTDRPRSAIRTYEKREGTHILKGIYTLKDEADETEELFMHYLKGCHGG